MAPVLLDFCDCVLHNGCLCQKCRTLFGILCLFSSSVTDLRALKSVASSKTSQLVLFVYLPFSNVVVGVFACVGWQVTLCDPIW